MDQNSNLETHHRRESYKLHDRKPVPVEKSKPRPPPQLALLKEPEVPFKYTTPATTTAAKHLYQKDKLDFSSFITGTGKQEENTPQSKRVRSHDLEDNDTCLIGSVTQVDFENYNTDNLASNLLKDISNTTREVDPFNFNYNYKPSFENKKIDSSDKENQHFRGLEDSDKKNPLEMEFED